MTPRRTATPGAFVDAALAEAVRALCVRAGLCADAADVELEHAEGGIGADLVRITGADGRYWVAKRPLARLRVDGDWQAPQHRISVEAAWLRWANEVIPGLAPVVIAEAPEANLMLCSDPRPEGTRSWQQALRAGHLDPAVPRALGEQLGRLHGAGGDDARLAERFRDDALFHALRLRPLLHAAIEAHPDLKVELRACEAELASAGAGRTVIHGDVAPEHVQLGEDGSLQLVSGECAGWAPAHFDAAHAVTQLLFEWAAAPEDAHGWRVLARTFEAAWCEALAPPSAERQRMVLLIPALLLAGTDGLAAHRDLPPEPRARVRSFARNQLRVRPTRLDVLLDRYERSMGDID